MADLNTFGKLNFAVSFNPTTAFPLDARSIKGSYADAVAAAATAEEVGSSNTVYYYGMPLVVLEGGVATMYTIQGDKTLKEVGSAPVLDNSTIELNGAGEVSLKDFGKQYYKFNEADTIITGEYTYPDNMPADAAEGAYVKVGETWYQYAASAWAVASANPHESDWYEMTIGWKAGLEPKVVSVEGGTYAIAWYEPSTTTVEGISKIVSGLQTEVSNLTERQGAFESRLSEIEAQGTVKVDDVTIQKDAETGVISVKQIDSSKVSDLESKLTTTKTEAVSEANTYTDTYAVKKSSVVKAGETATNVDSASDEKVVSEKAMLSSMSWIIGM